MCVCVYVYIYIHARLSSFIYSQLVSENGTNYTTLEYIIVSISLLRLSLQSDILLSTLSTCKHKLCSFFHVEEEISHDIKSEKNYQFLRRRIISF